jgi:hypothetical protein
MSDSLANLLTERQKRIARNWDDHDKSEKEEIKEKFTGAVADLHLLYQLPPIEAQKVVGQAIETYYRSPDFDTELSLRAYEKRHDVGEVVAAQELIAELISVLYNGTNNRIFERGVNEGVTQTLEWLADAGVSDAKRIRENTHLLSDSSRKTAFTEHLNEGHIESSSLTIQEELLRRIYQRENFSVEQQESAVEFASDRGWYELKIDQLREEREEIIESLQDAEENDLPHNSIQTALKQLDALIKSREKAREIAHSINNPKVSVFSREQFTQHEQREFIELHRDALDEEGILPDEENLPKYPNLETSNTPDPTQLDLGKWVNTEKIREEYQQGTDEAESKSDIKIIEQDATDGLDS